MIHGGPRCVELLDPEGCGVGEIDAKRYEMRVLSLLAFSCRDTYIHTYIHLVPAVEGYSTQLVLVLPSVSFHRSASIEHRASNSLRQMVLYVRPRFNADADTAVPDTCVVDGDCGDACYGACWVGSSLSVVCALEWEFIVYVLLAQLCLIMKCVVTGS